MIAAGAVVKWLLERLCVLMPGGLAGALRRRHVDGVIPGTLLAFALLAAALGRPPRWNVDLWQRLGMLAGGTAQALLVGAKKRTFLDIPLDFRIVLAVSIGFFLRGVVRTVSGLIR